MSEPNISISQRGIDWLMYSLNINHLSPACYLVTPPPLNSFFVTTMKTLADWFMPLNTPTESRWCRGCDGILLKTYSDGTKRQVYEPYDVDEFPPDGIPDTPDLKLLSLSVDGALDVFYGKDLNKRDEIEELIKEWILDNCRILKFGPKRNVTGYIIVWNDKHADFEEVCRMITELKL